MSDLFLAFPTASQRVEEQRLVYRCEKTCWIGAKGDINFRTRYFPLKGKSCGDYLHIQDDIQEILACHDYSYDNADPVIHQGKNGKLYEVKYVNISRDWETGIVDGYDVELREYEEDLEQDT